MRERLKKLIRSVSETDSPIEVLLDSFHVTMEDGRDVKVDGTLSINPAGEDDDDLAEESEEPVDGDSDEVSDEAEEYRLHRGGVRLTCSEKETCVIDFEGDRMTMNVKKGSLFKDLVKRVEGEGEGEGFSDAEERFTLDVKYKDMTLVRNADPESLKSFLKKL